ncbi:class I SAM-dependent methyltransferase [Nocardioides hungaricus]
MVSSDVWDRETAERYDADSVEMFGPEVLDPTVDFLAEVADGGPALEFAVGTGRVAVPLAARGVPVSGIELSEPMVERLRAKAGPGEIPVVVGDMATSTVPGEFSLVYLVWNSISNLRTQDEQVQCFRNAARHLVPGGRFVVELWVPQLRRLPEGQSVAVGSVGSSHLVFDELDLATQGCVSHHYRHEPDGTVRYGAGRFRYAWPAELDLMARLAGMRLEARHADWRRTPFGSESTGHVSVWVRD